MKRLIKIIEWFLPYTTSFIITNFYFPYLVYKWGWSVMGNKTEAKKYLVK
jgi:hypothetical protein